MSFTKVSMYTSHILKGLLFNFMYQRKYNKDWDALLNRYLDALEKGLDHRKRCHTLDFLDYNNDKVEVWIENRHYCFGHLYVKGGKRVREDLQFRPSIHTMIRLQEFLDNPPTKEETKKMYEDLYK